MSAQNLKRTRPVSMEILQGGMSKKSKTENVTIPIIYSDSRIFVGFNGWKDALYSQLDLWMDSPMRVDGLIYLRGDDNRDPVFAMNACMHFFLWRAANRYGGVRANVALAAAAAQCAPRIEQAIPAIWKQAGVRDRDEFYQAEALYGFPHRDVIFPLIEAAIAPLELAARGARMQGRQFIRLRVKKSCLSLATKE